MRKDTRSSTGVALIVALPIAAALLGSAAIARATSGAPSTTSLTSAFGSSVGGESLGVQADRLDVDVGSGEAILTGNVALTKGDLRVACPRIELKFDATPKVAWARGSGGVSADVRGVHAEAPEVELDLSRQVLELRGGVRLTRGQGWLQAERATIEISTAKVTLAQVKGLIPVPVAGASPSAPSGAGQAQTPGTGRK